MERQNQLQQLIAQHYPNRPFTLEFAAADADFRRYFRATFDNGDTLICMDAPPDKMSIEPYLKVREVFSAVRVPQLYHIDKSQGFIIMEDLGRATFLQAMQMDNRPEVHKTLLLEAVNTLIDLQKSSQAGVLPEYDKATLTREINLFPEWYAPKEKNHHFTLQR